MGWCEPLCCVFPIIKMDPLCLKQLCQCYELWSMTSCFNTSRVKRKDFAPSAESFSLCFNRTEINDVHPLWQTHRVTLRSFTKVPPESRSRVCFCGFHHPLPPWEVGAAPRCPWRSIQRQRYLKRTEGNKCYGCDAAGFKQSEKPLNTMKDTEIRAYHLTWRSTVQELRATSTWP